ncbi:uncharacterized protein M421DRAFT_406811 [Didymella exigua CBS 183.55]|uniref:Uncharacterized protein n=1 Tax=Didymella exigua CBS 183.55 TaxID=1150837 RepID=A0A6A5RC63_9PLEO|nr:uncharacterized protein M421DRAFT_406811 [Didymella exigua CBS 183.55]KAF1923347.1 hypothetical protein M421DRAFT_406811 [Didymella exigua CBS 183.55]
MVATTREVGALPLCRSCCRRKQYLATTACRHCCSKLSRSLSRSTSTFTFYKYLVHAAKRGQIHLPMICASARAIVPLLSPCFRLGFPYLPSTTLSSEFSTIIAHPTVMAPAVCALRRKRVCEEDETDAGHNKRARTTNSSVHHDGTMTFCHQQVGIHPKWQLAEAPDSAYVPANSPSKPEWVSPHTTRTDRAIGSTIEQDIFEDFYKRMQRDLSENPSSIIPGIPQNYIYSVQSAPLYAPSNIWKLRHLKPLQRQQNYLQLRGLCDKLNLLSPDDQLSRNIVASMMTKSALLQQAELNFYRIYMKRMFIMDGEYDKKKCYLPWNVITKHQSFDTCINEDGQAQIVRNAPGPSSTCVSPVVECDHSEDPEEVDVDKVLASCSRDVISTDGNLYEQNKTDIEADWAAKPLTRKKAALWEKFAYWKERHPLASQSLESVHAKPAFEAQRQPQVATLSTMSRVTPIVDPTAASGQQDGEDANDPSTWHKYPGQENRYRCGHRSYSCIEGSCENGSHFCCRNGLSLSAKKASFKRAERQNRTKEQRGIASDGGPAAKGIRKDQLRQVFKDAKQEAKWKNSSTISGRKSTTAFAIAQQEPLNSPVAPQPAARQVALLQSLPTPLPQQQAAANAYKRAAPIEPTIRPLSQAMRRYRREAEHRERQHSVGLQNWPRFKKWWDAQCRQDQGHHLTPEEKQILQRSEPSTERRTMPTPQPVSACACGEETAGAVYETPVSDDDYCSLFGDKEETSTEQQAQQSAGRSLATEEELLEFFDDDEL